MKNHKANLLVVRTMMHACMLFLVVQPACAAGSPVGLDLEATSVSELQAHSGRRVVLTGYFVCEFEVSALFPRALKPREYELERAVWVDLAATDDTRFFGLDFRGTLEVEGYLRADPDGQHGHLGGYPAELVDAKIIDVLPREWGIPTAIVVVAFSASALLMRALKNWWRKRQHRNRKPEEGM